MAGRSIVRQIIAVFDRSAAKKAERDMEDSLERAGSTGGQKAGKGFLKELRAAFNKRKAKLSEDLASGTIDQKEFKKQTAIAAKTFNDGLLKGIAQARREGTLTDKEYVKLTRNLKRVGDQGTSAFSRIRNGILAAGGALAAFFSVRAVFRWVQGSVEAFGAFDLAMQQSIAIMGDVDQAMRDRMAATARKVAKEVNISAADLAQGFYFLASAGLTAEQSIAALPQVARFAKAGAFDLQSAVTLLADAQSALGLRTADATENLRNQTRVSDVLVRANELANASVSQFSEALTNRAGAALKAFHKDVEEGVAVLAAYASQGIKGADAGTDLSRVLRLLTQAAFKNKDELAQLGITLTDARGNMLPLADQIENVTKGLAGMSDTQRGAALTSIGFQARMQDAILPLLGAADAIRGYEKELRAAGGTTEDVANKQLSAFSEQMGILRQKITDLRIELGEKLAPVLKGVANNFDAIVQIIPALTKALVVGGAIAALIRLRTAIVAARAATDAWKASIIGARVLMGPTGWFVLGIAALTELFRRHGAAVREAARALDDWRDSLNSMSLDDLRSELEKVAQQRRGIQAELDRYTAEGEKRLAEDAKRRLAIVTQGGLDIIKRIHELEKQMPGGPAPETAGTPSAPTAPGTGTAAAGLDKEAEAAARLIQQREGLLAQMLREIDVQKRRAAAIREGQAAVDALNRQLYIEDAVLRSGAERGSEFEATVKALAAAQYDAAQATDAASQAAKDAQTSAEQAIQAMQAQAEATHTLITGLFDAFAQGGISAITKLAKAKVVENLAWAAENFAKALGWISLGNFPSAAAAKASAIEHLVAAGKWGLAAGVASAAGSGGGGGGAGAVGGPTLPRTASDTAASAQGAGPDIVIHIDGVDPKNSRHQNLIGETSRQYAQRYGGRIRIE